MTFDNSCSVFEIQASSSLRESRELDNFLIFEMSMGPMVSDMRASNHAHATNASNAVINADCSGP